MFGSEEERGSVSCGAAVPHFELVFSDEKNIHGG
jgi:hypothetical protein